MLGTTEGGNSAVWAFFRFSSELRLEGEFTPLRQRLGDKGTTVK